MQLRTILNSIQKFKGFKYRRIKLERDAEGKRLMVQIEPDKRCKGRCSRCGTPGSKYDTLPERQYQFVPLWAIPVFFLYAARRIACQPCGKPVVEEVPWALGKSPITRAFAWFLAAWAKRMSWQETADAFKVSWDTVFGAVSMAVTYGLAHRKLEGIETIGVDEVSWQTGRFLTAVYQLDEHCRRLLWLGEERKEKTLHAFFDILGDAARKLRAVASDMWTPFINVIRDRAPRALHVLRGTEPPSVEFQLEFYTTKLILFTHPKHSYAKQIGPPTWILAAKSATPADDELHSAKVRRRPAVADETKAESPLKAKQDELTELRPIEGVERQTQTGDVWTVDINGVLGTQNVGGKDVKIEIGATKDEFLPGISKALEDLEDLSRSAVGSVRTITFLPPQERIPADFKGQEATLTIGFRDVREKHVPVRDVAAQVPQDMPPPNKPPAAGMAVVARRGTCRPRRRRR